LDIYLPAERPAPLGGKDGKVPVVVIAMGGAWIIGYRAWCSQLALRLAEAGILVVGVDYRNFPFAHVHDMVEDLETALDWIFANIGSYGGDVGNMGLMGQSAGAHLEALLLLERALAEARMEKDGRPACQAKDEAQGNGEQRRTCLGSLCKVRGDWSVRDLKVWVGVSGVYDLVALEDLMRSRGIVSWLPRLCATSSSGAGNEAAAGSAILTRHSPQQLLESAEWSSSLIGDRAAALLPPMMIFHGEADNSAPPAAAASFAEKLRGRGIAARLDMRPGVTHSGPIVEDPFRGGDMQAELVVPFLGEEARQRLAALPLPRPRPPAPLVAFAEYLMPF